MVGGVWSGWEDQAIHFETLGEGQGANMALPVMALFLRKVYNDPRFSALETEEFEVPENFNMELDCNKVNRGNPEERKFGRGSGIRLARLKLREIRSRPIPFVSGTLRGCS